VIRTEQEYVIADQNKIRKERKKYNSKRERLTSMQRIEFEKRNDFHTWHGTWHNISIILDQNETLLLRNNYDFFARKMGKGERFEALTQRIESEERKSIHFEPKI